MPYRNALRDNWQRYQSANDAEMRLAARQQMMSAVPQGEYASNGMSIADIYRVLTGSAPVDYQPGLETGQQEMVAEQQIDPNYNPQAGGDAIRRRRAELAAALQEY